MNPLNIKFEYLHRDESNYKFFGQIILNNSEGLDPVRATFLLKDLLIDGEYFYPKVVGVPLFEEHRPIAEFFTDWYEFHSFSFTTELATDNRSLKEFLANFQK